MRGHRLGQPKIYRVVPADPLAVTFHHLATAPSPGFAVGGRLSELRFEADVIIARPGGGLSQVKIGPRGSGVRPGTILGT